MRLINAEDLREAIREAAMESDVTVLDVLTTIDLFPTIDAEPVIHGRWIKKWGYVCPTAITSLRGSQFITIR